MKSLKEKLNDEALWNDHKEMNKISSQISGLEREIGGWLNFQPKLKDMVLVRNSRLSVQPVSAEEWRLVCRMGGM